MLTKNEITYNAFPNPTLEELMLKREPSNKKPNIIKNAIFNEEKKLNLYLPLNIPIYKKDFYSSVLYDNNKSLARQKKLDNIRKQLNSFSFKPQIYKRKINKDDKMNNIIESIKDNRNKLQEMEEKNQKNLAKLSNSKDSISERPFNIKNLIKEVKEIAKSAALPKYKKEKEKEKERNKFEIAKKFRENAISNKKDSSPFEEFLDVERSRDYLYLQKLILDIEYRNVVDKNLKKNKYEIAKKFRINAISNKKDSSPFEEFLDVEKSRDYIYLQKLVLDIEYRNVVDKNIKPKKEVIYTVNNYDIEDEENENLQNNKNKPIRLFKNKSRNHLIEKISEICSSNNSRINSAHKKNILNEELFIQNSNFEKELLEKNNIKFFHRYQNCLNNIKREEKRHYNNKIFSNSAINQIMKSKNDLEIDKLKYDFTDKIGAIEANNKGFYHKKDPEKKIKEKKEAMSCLNHRIYNAFENDENGKIDTANLFKIEDYIKL